ncbi:Lactoylglutathione lyase, partial [Trichinella spiralis]
LLQCKPTDKLPKKSEINPRDNHISFQCPDILSLEKRLQELGIKYEKRIVKDEGLFVDQLFIHDPDGYMVELCNCENLP